MSHNTVSILADTAEMAEDIDVAQAEADVRRLQDHLARTDDAAAEAELRRAHARILAVGGVGAVPSRH